ncbi:MAG: hypothetical protein K2Y08_04950 [Alphaproteobacteria bacterium]|nr:hypothetical protein [Alphaproteobacteria bacterium]
MKKIIILSLLFFWSANNVFAIPQPSPNRCKGENWWQIDTLLPDQSDKNYIQTIQSKQPVITDQQILQSAVDYILTIKDLCGQPVTGMGGWTDMLGTALCERLAYYNLTKADAPKSSMAPDDLTFLQTAHKACRPTTQRWWNHNLILHVHFQPTEAENTYFKSVIKRS